MLQLNTGKFYSSVGRTNEIRGVIYTNLRFDRLKPIETAAGTLSYIDSSDANSVLFEMIERFESADIASGVIYSHTLEPYAADFSVIVSFAMKGLCATNSDTIVRLTEGGRRIGVTNRIKEHLTREFSREIYCQDEEIKEFVEFAHDLMLLDRPHYEAAMNAMRTYISALFCLADDFELAYTLLVASLEPMAQGFDGHRASWDDYDQQKRSVIDTALKGAEIELAERVRAAILENEHVAVSRRFKDFILKNIDPVYFKPDLKKVANPIGRGDLETAIKQAYIIRSKYVHLLKELPRQITHLPAPGEFKLIDGVPTLTFEGLTRLVRHVVMNFVHNGPKVERAKLPPTFQRYGTVTVQLGADYWMGNTDNIAANSGNSRLEGFLSQVACHLEGVPGATITNIDTVLEKVELLLKKKMTNVQRRPFVALHFIYGRLCRGRAGSDAETKFLDTYARLLDSPSLEAWISHLLNGTRLDWLLKDYDEVYSQYLRQRSTGKGLRLPNLFGIAIGLDLAELCRVEKSSVEVQQMLQQLVEHFPGSAPLRAFESEYTGNSPIDWQRIMLPGPSQS